MLRMVSYPHRLKIGHVMCYLNRTYHVPTTKRRQESSSDAKYLIRCAIISELADFLFASKLLILKRKWWNWQTHHLEGVAPQGVGVQIPPSAPVTNLYSISYKPICPIVR